MFCNHLGHSWTIRLLVAAPLMTALLMPAVAGAQDTPGLAAPAQGSATANAGTVPAPKPTQQQINDAAQAVKNAQKDALDAQKNASDAQNKAFDLRNKAAEHIRVSLTLPSAKDTISSTEAGISRLETALIALKGQPPTILDTILQTDEQNLKAAQDALDKAITTLDKANKSLDAANKALQQLDTKNSALTPPKNLKPQDTLKAAQDESTKDSAALSTDAKQAGSIAQARQKITDSVAGLLTYAANIGKLLETDVAKAMPPMADPKDTSYDIPAMPTAQQKSSVKIKITELRKTLKNQIPAVRNVARLQQRLTAINSSLTPLANTDNQKASLKTLQTSLTTTKQSFMTVSTSLSLWFVRIQNYVDARQGDLLGEARQIKSGNLVGVEVQGELAEMQGIVGDLHFFQNAWPDLATVLQDAATFGDINDALQKVSDAVSGLSTSELFIGSTLSLLDESLAGDLNKYVHDQVRLFYFSDVPRVMRALNPDTITFTPDGGNAQQQADNARKQLLQSDADVAAQFAQINTLQRRVVAIQEEIRQVHARATDATNRLNAANARKAGLQNLLAKLMTQQTNMNAAATADQKQKIQDQITAVQAQQADQDTAITNAQTAQTAAQQEEQNLRDEQSALPSRLVEAQTALANAQTEIARLRRLSVGLAQQDVDAFANARDNSPVLIAHGNITSTDPARRVIMYGYPDSKTILLRGKADDVIAVKNLIAEFDRPAPQARITLYTLQMNGTYTRALNRALAVVDSTLRDLRGNITLIQDLLRNSINNEVNRISEIAQLSTQSINIEGKTFKSPFSNYNSRLARYFYYPQDFRRQLGFRFVLPPRVAAIATLKYDVAMAKQYVDKAYEAHRGILQQNSEQGRQTLRSKREELLRSAANHLFFADQELTRALEISRSSLGHLQKIENDFKAIKPVLARFVEAVNKNQSDEKFTVAFRCYDCSPKAATLNDINIALESYRRCDSLLDTDRIEAGILLPFDPKLNKSGNMPLPIEEAYKAQLDELVRDTEHVTRWTLPDPAHATTLGEMLFILSLGEQRSRERILQDFVQRLDDLFPTSGGKQTGGLVNFRDQIKQVFEQIRTDNSDLSGPQTASRGHINFTPYPYFPRTILGATESRVSGEALDGKMTANQLEILLAIDAKARESVAAEVNYLLWQIDQARQDNQMADRDTQLEQNLLREQILPLVGWLHSKAFEHHDELKDPAPDAGGAASSETSPAAKTRITPGTPQNVVKTLQNNSATPGVSTSRSQQLLRTWFQEGLNATTQARSIPADIVKTVPNDPTATVRFPTGLDEVTWHWENARQEDMALQRLDYAAWNIANVSAQRNALAQAVPRVAAADDMIKRMIQRAEDDLEHFLVEDALETIRRETSGVGGVELGIFQRESILVTNRIVARVDPNANANLQIAGGTEFAQQATQLGNITSRFVDEQKTQKLNLLGPLAGGGIAKLAGATDALSLGLGGALSLLGALAAEPRADLGEVYSINSGSLFKVTPIFDPSGQALRFQFDYSSTTRLEEPNGTVNPQLPRVERHDVNNVVQLTNLEFREITRFENNARVGTPAQRIGGVPLLKELPLLKDIPIIGYYIRKGASKAVRQESLLFAQTSIYPTVGDIVDLLTDVPSRPNLKQEVPTYLNTKQPSPPVTLPKPVSSSSDNMPATTPTAPVEPCVPFTVQIDPSDVLLTGGDVIRGTVKVVDKTPEADRSITLKSDSLDVAFSPPTLTLHKGDKTSIAFRIFTSPVNKLQRVTISALCGNSNSAATLSIRPPKISRIDIGEMDSANCRKIILTLNAPAPANMPDTKITLNDANYSVDHPTLHFNERDRTATFLISSKQSHITGNKARTRVLVTLTIQVGEDINNRSVPMLH